MSTKKHHKLLHPYFSILRNFHAVMFLYVYTCIYFHIYRQDRKSTLNKIPNSLNI